MQSFKVEVNTFGAPADDWPSNRLRFATKLAAEVYANDLASRWTAVREWRVVKSNDAPNRQEVSE